MPLSCSSFAFVYPVDFANRKASVKLADRGWVLPALRCSNLEDYQYTNLASTIHLFLIGMADRLQRRGIEDDFASFNP